MIPIYDPRYQQLRDKIIELSKGHFNTFLRTSKEHDYLDGIMTLVNMLSENWKERILHIPFVKESKSSNYLQIFSIVTNERLEILHTSTYAKDMLQLTDRKLIGVPITDLLAPTNTAELHDACRLLTAKPHKNIKLQLYFIHLNLSLHYETHLQYCADDQQYLFHFIGLRSTETAVPMEKAPSSSNRLLHKSYIDLKIQEIYDYLNSLEDFKEVSYATLCHKYRINEQQLKTRFKALYNKTVYQHQLELRMLRSKQLVTDTRNPFKNIAAAAGFTDYSNYMRNFKKFFGTSPRELRKKHQG